MPTRKGKAQVAEKHMNQFPLLPGATYGGPPQPEHQISSRPSRWLTLVIVLWLISGVVFVALRLRPNLQEVTTKYPPSDPVVTAIGTEDTLQHLEHVNRKLAEASANLKRAQDQIAATLPAIERYSLLVE